MDLKDQLKNLFPDHVENIIPLNEEKPTSIWMQDAPIICKYEKRKGKPITIVEGYTGADDDFKSLAKDLKKKFSVGGSFKNDTIIIQGDFRDKIMNYLKEIGFNVKRVGG
tara:strand:- start:2489 stop:2818 length:330 start_codon:yes stop_codon:yes gene_type:complete